jgi:hypothetical protein
MRSVNNTVTEKNTLRSFLVDIWNRRARITVVKKTRQLKLAPTFAPVLPRELTYATPNLPYREKKA